jgi:hypothetical protein
MATLSKLVRARLPRRGGRPINVETLRCTHPDIEPAFVGAWQTVRPLHDDVGRADVQPWHGVRHVRRRAIDGDVVERGVWRGGSSMLSALALRQECDEGRTVGSTTRSRA